MGKRLSSKLYDAGMGRLVHWCPGCKSLHMIHTQNPNHLGACWEFDGDVEVPTFSPSVNIDMGEWPPGNKRRCHYFIRNGEISFCSDSTHTLSGQVVPLPDLPQKELG